MIRLATLYTLFSAFRMYAPKTRLMIWGLLLVTCHAHAQHTDTGNASRSYSVYWGQGADVNLPEIPKQARRGDLRLEPTYLASISVRQGMGRLHLTHFHLPSPLFSVEAQLTKHHGLQNNYEGHIAMVFSTTKHDLLGLGIQLSLASGLSHAFSTPRYEDGPGGKKNGRRYPTQHFLGLEAAFSRPKNIHWNILLRIHHRSGIYGLIAPSGVGSNFITLGLRYAP